MTPRQFLTNVTIIAAMMALGALLEVAVPMFIARRGRDGRRNANLGLTAVGLLLNWCLTSVAAVAALSLRPAGLMSQLTVPFWAQVALGIVVLDFSVGYLSHRTLHMLPTMWRFHRIHHNDTFVDITTTYRTHPVETGWRFLFAIVPVWIVGIPAQAVLVHRLLQVINGILEHANIRLWAPVDRLVSLVWVTPNVHKMHHSRELAETNSNYGNVLSIYDRLLGTFTPAHRAASVIYGLDDDRGAESDSLPRLLAMPFDPDEKVTVATAAPR